MRRRKTKPTQLHVIEGGLQPVRHIEHASGLATPQGLDEVPPPEWLTPAQQTLWHDILATHPARRAPRNRPRAGRVIR